MGRCANRRSTLVGKHPIIDVEMKGYLPTAPDNFKKALQFDDAWWNAHGDELQKRFDEWRGPMAPGQGKPADRRGQAARRRAEHRRHQGRNPKSARRQNILRNEDVGPSTPVAIARAAKMRAHTVLHAPQVKLKTRPPKKKMRVTLNSSFAVLSLFVSCLVAGESYGYIPKDIPLTQDAHQEGDAALTEPVFRLHRKVGSR